MILKDGTLSGELKLSKPKNIINVKTEIENCVYILQIIDTVKNTELFCSELKQTNENIISCVIICPNEWIELKLSAHIIMWNGNESKYTNSVPITIDKTSLQMSTINKSSKDIQIAELTKDIAELKKLIKTTLSGLVIKTLPEFDKKLLRKGMVLTCINDSGAVAFSQPFSDNITSINGKRAINKELEINARDINMDTGKSINNAIVSLTKAVEELSKNLANVSAIVSAHTTDIANIKTLLLDYTGEIMEG